jgi:hypothetical protein
MGGMLLLLKSSSSVLIANHNGTRTVLMISLNISSV